MREKEQQLNNAVERAAGSHTLAADAHCERWTVTD